MGQLWRYHDAEKKYHIGEQELLAVVHALGSMAVLPARCRVHCCDSPNTFFEEKKVLSMRQGRWAEKLSRF